MPPARTRASSRRRVRLRRCAAKPLRFLREAGWITADRARAVAGIAVIAFLGAAVWLAQRDAGPNPALGHDFAAFWSASVLINGGRAAEAYNRATLFAVQQGMFGPGLALEAPFLYPPPFLFAAWPMAWLPFGAALAAWVILTSALCIAALVRLAGGAWALVPAMALPSLWFNAGFGQNGALTAALFGGAAVLLDRRPVLAGLCLGLLCYKPQLALAVPVALIAARRWTAFLASGATAAVMAFASLAVFGPEAWLAFLQQTRTATVGIEAGLAGFDKIVSPFGVVRTLDGPASLAYAVQALSGALACLLLVRVVRGRPGGAAEVAALVCATLFCSPYLLVYDLTIMVVPLIWLFRRLREEGTPLPWESLALLVLALTPIPGWGLSRMLGVQAAPAFSLLLFWLVARRLQVEDHRARPRTA